MRSFPTLRDRPGAPGLGAGEGLGVVLCFIEAFGPGTLCFFGTRPLPAVPLGGLLLWEALCRPPLGPVLRSSCLGCSSTLTTAAGLTNIPKPCSQSKYRSPWTDPSFLPVGSPSSTPIQSPGAKLVLPMKRMIAFRPSDKQTTWPGERSPIFEEELPAEHQRQTQNRCSPNSGHAALGRAVCSWC